MSNQIPLDASAQADHVENGLHIVGPDLAFVRLTIVNAVLYGTPEAGDRGWVLIDAGIPGSGEAITQAAAKRFGHAILPKAIVLTHGHFDHVGALENLASRWEVPIYAHPAERPYLDGTSSYPAPDPSVGGGMMARAASLYPRGPVNVGSYLHDLDPTGEVQPMPGWRWLHTPGHTPGHVSLWRPADRTLITGDAFITTNQESAYDVIRQKPEMHGPPQYYTPDWESARRSVQQLAQLEPEVAITMHGLAFRGPDMRSALTALARDFDQVAVPENAR